MAKSVFRFHRASRTEYFLVHSNVYMVLNIPFSERVILRTDTDPDPGERTNATRVLNYFTLYCYGLRSCLNPSVTEVGCGACLRRHRPLPTGPRNCLAAERTRRPGSTLRRKKKSVYLR